MHYAGQMEGPINLETHFVKFWEISVKYLFDNVLLIVRPVLFLEYKLQLVASAQIFSIFIDFFVCLVFLSVTICNYGHGFICSFL